MSVDIILGDICSSGKMVTDCTTAVSLIREKPQQRRAFDRKPALCRAERCKESIEGCAEL